MTTRTAAGTTREPLTRRRVLDAALAYIDQHGLAALSMHKLGAELGVKGMSLYNHVANKDDVLDGVVETLWDEVERAAPAQADWRTGARTLARAIRDVMHHHPQAASLITVRQLMPVAALRTVQTHLATMTGSGIPEDRAYALLRTIWTYALGTAQAEICWDTCRDSTRRPAVGDLLRPQTPAELAAVAEIFCGRHDPDAQFELGLDLMLRGIGRAPAE
ncbi:TetR/AcrR family transcriptional regulator C-terminal domain-containing protein [Streptomyces sp. NPDC048415]|uniref:TetR/AcrR family transcriptional regulator n=1 Tax=Streptomyces sp. NPDC048415 TaxID=3154822 RepID=UPI0034207F0C